MLCFRKFLVAKKFMEKKEGEVSRFLLITFCLKVPKNAVGEPYSNSLISGIEKNFASTGFWDQFLSKNFCLRVLQLFVEDLFSAMFQKISGSENVY